MTSPTGPLVSVVVPHYNDLDGLGLCLDSLRRQTLGQARFEVIVADNNSAGGVCAVRRLAPDVLSVPAPTQGAGPARNAGVAASHGRILAFIDADCIADQDWLQQGISALDDFDYIGGQVVTKAGDDSKITPAEAVETVFAFNFKRYVEKEKFSGTGNLFMPRAVFDRVGEFRSGVSEDVDWCRRANALGLRLGYAERAVVYHPARREWRELTNKWDRVIAETLRLAREQPGWRLRWLGYAVAVAVSPLVHWINVVRSPRLVGLRAKYCGVLGLLRLRSYRSYRMLRCLVHPPD